MKYFILFITVLFFSVNYTAAQTTKQVSGTVIDSTKLSVPGASVKLTSNQGDSSVTAADVDGKFSFNGIKGDKITLTITSIGFQSLIKHFSLDVNDPSVNLGSIMMQLERNMLSQVNIVGQVNPVVMKEDTVEYKVSAYKVRDNAPIEDVIKKLPGVDVDKDGNVSAQGKQITKVRVNGKDFFGGDVQTATKNLPADIVESIQVVDDYGDQANLTGVKTGEPNKILNINIRQDKNYGYSVQATAGDGYDALPKDPGVTNANRYLGTINSFKFKGDQQISLLGNLNNTNVNTFSFGSATSGGFGGNFNGGGGGGGGRGNALRGGSSGQTTGANGITDARSLGLNFRDEWGKKVSVYGSYSFSDNTTLTNTNSLQINRFQIPSTNQSVSNQTRNPLNHRLNFNIEYRPDTINYFKFVPSFSYSRTNSSSFDDVLSLIGDSTNLAYNVNSVTNTTAPNYGLNVLYNHRFSSKGRNFSLNLSYNNAKNDQYDNPIYNYTHGVPTSPINQQVNTDSRTSTFGANVSYLEPLSKLSFLEFNYAFNHSYTTSDKQTDTLNVLSNIFDRYDLLSNNYDYTFTTNRVGLNYRFIEKKYNYTLGIGVQPGSLRGNSLNAPETIRNTFNVIPTARFIYNFSRSQSLSFNYNGSSNQPSFNQLQPVLDLSNALYPVIGNPNLKPEFSNNLSLRYNKFAFETGNVLFTRLDFTQTNDKVVSQTTTYRNLAKSVLDADPSLKNLQNTNLISYRNVSGYYSGSANAVFSKPWSQRKYTLFLSGNVSYTKNLGFSNSVDSMNRATAFEQNVTKNLVFTPGVRFRINITDVVDAEVNSSYLINRTVSSIGNDPLLNQNTNTRTLNLGVNGKNYFWKDWTLSYDFTRSINYGYSSTIKVTNPNILNVYVERRFMKNNQATIRVQGFDLFNQNKGFTSTDTGTITTQSNTNRLSRYFLLTFTFRLQKFAGKAPSQGPPGGRGSGGGMGGPPPGGGPGGPGI